MCHSDLHFVDGNYTMAMPAVIGHEAAGTVEAVGDQLFYVKPGGGVEYSFEALAPKRLLSRPSRCWKMAERRPSSAWSPRGRRSNSTATHFSESAGFSEAAWARTVFESTCPGTSNTILQGRLKLEQINETFEDMKQGHVARSVITFD